MMRKRKKEERERKDKEREEKIFTLENNQFHLEY